MFVNVPSFRVWATGDWSPALCSVVFTLCYRRSFMQTFSLQDFICASGLILHFIEVTVCVMFSKTCSAPTFPSYCYQWNYCPPKHNENKYFAAPPTECKTLHDIHTEQTCALSHETLAIIFFKYGKSSIYDIHLTIQHIHIYRITVSRFLTGKSP